MEKEKLWIILAILVIALSIAGTFFFNKQKSDDGTTAYGEGSSTDIESFDSNEISSNVGSLGSDDEVFSEIDETLDSLE